MFVHKATTFAAHCQCFIQLSVGLSQIRGCVFPRGDFFLWKLVLDHKFRRSRIRLVRAGLWGWVPCYSHTDAFPLRCQQKLWICDTLIGLCLGDGGQRFLQTLAPCAQGNGCAGDNQASSRQLPSLSYIQDLFIKFPLYPKDLVIPY